MILMVFTFLHLENYYLEERPEWPLSGFLLELSISTAHKPHTIHQQCPKYMINKLHVKSLPKAFEKYMYVCLQLNALVFFIQNNEIILET